MSTKKINLKCSVSALNAKVGPMKKKVLPKLKVILVNPYKPKYETLIDSELSQFKDTISSEIKSSGLSGRVFARQSNIQLGLGSSLRAIGNKKASCVIVSQSIKPKFIINQIVYFTKQTNSSVPVFIVDDWETISANLFGVKALVVVFPSTLSGVLGKWISERSLLTKDNKKPNNFKELVKPTKPQADGSNFNLDSMYLTRPSNGTRSFIPDVVVKSKPIPVQQSKDWTGDFISFSNRKESMEDFKMDMDKVDEEFMRKQDQALDALQRMAKKVDIDSEPPMIIIESKNDTIKPLVCKSAAPNTDDEVWQNDTSYISLEVHKIQPNPKRKPKSKRKNKKQKQQLKK